MTDTLEPLNGLIERVTFHNAESGFAVLQVTITRPKQAMESIRWMGRRRAGFLLISTMRVWPSRCR